MRYEDILLYDSYNGLCSEELYKELYEDSVYSNFISFEDFKANQIEVEGQRFQAFLEFADSEADAFVVTGTLYRWNGQRQIEATRYVSLKEAYKACIGRYTDFIEVRFINGILHVAAGHHDGTNSFEIHALNKKGAEAGDQADLSKATYHKKIRYIF